MGPVSTSLVFEVASATAVLGLALEGREVAATPRVVEGVGFIFFAARGRWRRDEVVPKPNAPGAFGVVTRILRFGGIAGTGTLVGMGGVRCRDEARKRATRQRRLGTKK